MDSPEPQTNPLISFDLAVDGDRHATVMIAGELDMSSVEPLAVRVDEALAQGVSSLTVDVSQVRFADSSAIALWVRWAGQLERLELREPPPLLRKVIAAMGLDEKLGLA